MSKITNIPPQNTPKQMLLNLTLFTVNTNWLTKLLVVFFIWITPIIPLFLLLVGLISLDYLLDVVRIYKDSGPKDHIRSLIWEQTKIWLWKLFAYSALALMLNGLHLYLFKGSIDIIRWVFAVPIMSESVGILRTIEHFSGVSIVENVKKIFKGWFDKTAGIDSTPVDDPKK